MEKKFEFSHESQKKIFAMFLFDKEFLKSYGGLIKPDYFDNPVLKDLSKIVINFYEKYSRAPDTDEFLQELDDLITKEKKRSKNFPLDEYFEIAKEILTIGNTGKFDYVRDKALAFAKYQAMKQALLISCEKFTKSDPDRDTYYDIVKLISEAAIAGDRDEPMGLKEINCETVEPEDVTWLWQNRIPLGKLTFIIGDPGVGKSFLMASLSKHITTGEGWPDTPHGSVEKGSVLLLNAEDGLADTIVRRLEWAGADRSKVTFIEATIERKGEERTFRIDKDLSKLEESLKAKRDVKLIIFDPLSAYLGEVDSYRDTEVRRILAPLVLLAEKYKVAVLAVLHMNKKQSIQAIYRVPGSIGFAGAARVIWYVSEDEETEGRKLFSGMKNNLSAKPMRDLGLAFQLKKGKVIWEEVPMRKTTQEILKDQEKPKRARDKAMEFLKELLEKGPMAQVEIEELVEDEEFGWRTAQEAKRKLKIDSYREGGRGGKWYWKLPEKEKETVKVEKETEKEEPKEETPEEVEAKPEKGDGMALAKLARRVRRARELSGK